MYDICFIHDAHSIVILSCRKGYLSLAETNFKHSNGLRFGQDRYDDRMRALRRVDVRDSDQGDEIYHCHVLEPRCKAETELTMSEKDAADSGQKSSAHSSPGEAKASEANTGLGEPLRWFGVLVPLSLRKCQQSFVSALDQQAVFEAANASHALLGIETEIVRLRKAIDDTG